MRKFFLIAAGWLLVVVGLLATFSPIPIPLIGIVPLLIGCALLSTHSKRFRRALQRLRHRFAFISRRMESLHHRMPHNVRTMIRRTNPRALLRLARMRRHHHHHI